METHDSRRAISAFLFVKGPPEPVDLAFVMCSPTIGSIQPALALYRAGLAGRLLILGAGPTPAGVRDSALLLEKAARNTAGNAAFGAALIGAEPGRAQVRRVAVCAKPFHMRPAIMTLRRHVPAEVRLVARPPDDPGDPSIDTWWKTEFGREHGLAELGRISAHALKGDPGDV